MTPSSSPRISARLAALGFAVLFLASACVNVAPIETGSSQPATARPSSSGQPKVTPAPTLGGEPTSEPTTPGATLEPGATPGPTTPGSSTPPIDPAVAAQIDAVVEQM